MYVSVIVPNYNHARFLNQRLESILNQTYTNYEIIILDDYSKDDSRSIIDQYLQSPKIASVIYNNINSGSPFKQWQKGIEVAKGEYIWIAESDDYCDPNFLSEVLAIFQQEENLVLCYCASNCVDQNSNSIGRLERTVQLNSSGYYINSGVKECKDCLFFHPAIPNASAVVFKRESYQKVDQSFKSYRIAGDWQFWIDISMTGDIAYIPFPLNYFRQSETSVSRSNHYSNNNYKIFFLEKLKIGNYVHQRFKNYLPLKHRIKYVDEYLFYILLESLRKKISLNKDEVLFVCRNLFSLTWLTSLIFFKSAFDNCMFVLKKIKRKMLK